MVLGYVTFMLSKTGVQLTSHLKYATRKQTHCRLFSNTFDGSSLITTLFILATICNRPGSRNNEFVYRVIVLKTVHAIRVLVVRVGCCPSVWLLEL